MEPNELIRIIDALLRFPRPSAPTPISVPPVGATAIEKAGAGLYLAINRVMDENYQHHLRDYEDWCNRLLEWREYLNTHGPRYPAESAAAVLSAEMTMAEALLGTADWEAPLDASVELLGWAQQRHLESARKASTTGTLLDEAIKDYVHSDAQIRTIVADAEPAIERLDPADETGRQTVIAAAQAAVADIAVADIAIAAVTRAHARIREVLDL